MTKGRKSAAAGQKPAAAEGKDGGGKADCIVLAAGASVRMGRPKLHLPFGSSTVLGSGIEAARAAGLRVIVVGRTDDESLARYAGDGVILARNPDPARGMLSTLRVGLELVASERFFFIPGDMPLVSPGTYALLLEGERSSPAIPTFGGRRGHPVLLPAGLIPAILGLGEDERLRDLIDAASPRFIETRDPGVLSDIDLPADYERARVAAKSEFA